MNAQNAKDFLPLVQALADGKTIQFQCDWPKEGWSDCKNPEFTDPSQYYRIKPEPREWEIQYLGINRYRVFGPEMESSKIRVREILD